MSEIMCEKHPKIRASFSITFRSFLIDAEETFDICLECRNEISDYLDIKVVAK